MNWYIIKVQSNREDSIADVLRRNVQSRGLEHYFGVVCVPTEGAPEVNPKSGKKRVIKRKLHPGCIVVQMVMNDDTWRLIHEIGDFPGWVAKPEPLTAHEIARIVGQTENANVETPKVVVGFRKERA